MATGRYLLSYGLPYRVTAVLCGLVFAGFLSLGGARFAGEPSLVRHHPRGLLGILEHVS